MSMDKIDVMQKYNEIFSHTIFTLLPMFVIWQLVPSPIVQKHECIQKLNNGVGSKYHKVGDLHLMVFCF
jgi:hypothetical protein